MFPDSPERFGLRGNRSSTGIVFLVGILEFSPFFVFVPLNLEEK